MDELVSQRKSPRLKKFDYSRPGYYFITICTHEKKKLLSQVVCEDNRTEIKLTPMGEIVDSIINNLPQRYKTEIHKYVIMPNHIHLIMIVNERTVFSDNQHNAERSRQIIEMAVGYIKMNSSKRIHNEISGDKIWQRSFHDHIIRGEFDYIKIWNYIHSNPNLWHKDIFYV